MPELFLSIPLALLIILACHEAGRICLALFKSDYACNDPLDNSLIRLATGYIVIGLILAIFGLVHILYLPVLWLLVILLSFTSLRHGRKQLAESLESFRLLFSELVTNRLNVLLLSMALIALAMDFILTCVPTTAWDALTYHYPLPAIWLNAHGFVPRMDICYSELPHGSEMLFLLAFGLGGLGPDNMGAGHLAANHLTWATGVFALIAIVSISRKLGLIPGTATNGNFWNAYTPGLIAAIAFLSLPIVFVEEMEGGYIENFLVFFSIVMLIAMVQFGKTKNAKLLTVIGLIAGGLLASKHTSLFIDALTLVILIVWISRSGNRKLYKPLAIAALLAIAVALPWYIKSYLHTGDPMYPFISALLAPDAAHPDIMYWSNPNIERSVSGFINYIPRLSWDESLVQFKFRLLTWYFLPILPFAVYWSFRRGPGRIIGLVAWILILLIYLLAPGEPRYMLAAWGLYAGLGAWGLLTSIDSLTNNRRLLSAILPVLLIIPIAFSLVSRTREVNNRVPTILGLATIDQYMDKSLDIWHLVKYINNETNPYETVILVEPRNFYIQRDFLIWYPFPTEPTRGWEQGAFDFNMYDQWRLMNAKYLVLTYGPNYRAIAIAKFLSGFYTDEGSTTRFFHDMPDWIDTRAAFAEPGSALNDNGNFIISDEQLDARFYYDYKSMLNIATHNGFGPLAFNDPRAGRIYRITDFNIFDFGNRENLSNDQ